MSPDEKASLKEVTMITCELRKNMKQPDANISGCKNQINQAAKVGGTAVLFEAEKQEIRKEYNNCIKLRGIAFKKSNLN